MPGDYYDDKAKSFGFGGKGELAETFNLKGAVWGSHLDRAIRTMDRIQELRDNWRSAPDVYNWRDTLTGGLVDGRTRKEICRDNLNRYLDTVQKSYKMDDAQLKKVCGLLGIPVNQNGRVALNNDLDGNPIKTDVKLAQAFNSDPTSETPSATQQAVAQQPNAPRNDLKI